MQLTKITNHTEWQHMSDIVQQQVQSIISQIQITQEKNLQKLIQDKNKTQNAKSVSQKTQDHSPKKIHNIYPRTQNNSDIMFTQEELNIIDLGYKHYEPETQNKHNLKQLVVDIEIATNNQQYKDKETTRHLASNEITNIIIKEKQSGTDNKSNKSTNKLIKQIKPKIYNNKLIVTKADKGQSTVIMTQ